MPSWKRVIVSGSDATLRTVSALSLTGSLAWSHIKNTPTFLSSSAQVNYTQIRNAPVTASGIFLYDNAGRVYPKALYKRINNVRLPGDVGKFYNLYQMDMPASLQGYFDIDVLFEGPGLGNMYRFEIPVTYNMDWINEFSEAPFNTYYDRGWVKVMPKFSTPRHMMDAEENAEFQFRALNNTIYFRVYVKSITDSPTTGSIESYIRHSHNFSGVTITEYFTSGTAATGSSVYLPYFIGGLQGSNIMHSPLTASTILSTGLDLNGSADVAGNIALGGALAASKYVNGGLLYRNGSSFFTGSSKLTYDETNQSIYVRGKGHSGYPQLKIDSDWIPGISSLFYLTGSNAHWRSVTSDLNITSGYRMYITSNGGAWGNAIVVSQSFAQYQPDAQFWNETAKIDPKGTRSVFHDAYYTVSQSVTGNTASYSAFRINAVPATTELGKSNRLIDLQHNSVEKFYVSSSGQVHLPEYDASTIFTGTANKILAVDTKGKVIVTDPGSSAFPSVLKLGSPTYTINFATASRYYHTASANTVWTLPSLAGDRDLWIKNRGSGSIYLKAASGEAIADARITGSMWIYAGESYIFHDDGEYWNVY